MKGESLDEYWDYTHRIFEWPDGGHSNMILDDGGDATLLLHLGAQAERDAAPIAHATNEEETVPFRRHQGQAGQGPDAGTPRGSARSGA